MFKELMGYCRPRWISDYTWKTFEARVRIISAMSAAGADDDDARIAIAAGLRRRG